MALPFDARPLTDPVPPAAIRAHRDELRRTGRLPGPNPGAIVVVVLVGVFALFVLGSVSTSVVVALALPLTRGEGIAWSGLLGMAVTVVLAGVIVAVLVRAMRRRGDRAYRLDTFARANGMQWFPVSAAPPLPGMVFGIGHDRKALDIVRGQRPRFVEFGNYRYTTGSGKNRSTHSWGYVAVKLSTPLPHIVLDARSNNSFFGSNLPATFHRDQVLSLEGDFDRFFTLYCPREYEQDALYLFTPDIMARFIDNAAALDVEIVDDWMFLYARRDFSTLDPGTWAWLFSVVGAFLDKLAQWERWRDERLARPAAPSTAVSTAESATESTAASEPLPFTPPNALLRPPAGVAAQGRRLRRGVSWPAIILFALFAAIWILNATGVLGSLVGTFLR